MTPPASGNTLPRVERLRGTKDIAALFNRGKWGLCGHVRFCWLDTGEQRPARIMVNVPKKYFKRAVKRNLLKRRMREAYRCIKHTADLTGVDFLVSWASPETADSDAVRADVAEVLQRIVKSRAR